MSKSIYITGTSMISSSGTGSEEVWNAILQQKVVKGIRTYPLDSKKVLKYPVYPIDVKGLLYKWIEPQTIDWLEEEGLTDDLDFILLLVASKLALYDAKIPCGASVSMVVGHENLGMNNLIDKILSPKTEELQHSFFENPMNSFQEYQQDFFRLQTFPHLFYLSKALGIDGLTYTVNNACASGLYALDMGKMMIESKQSDIVLVVTSDYAHVTEHLWLEKKGFVSKSNQLKPFDQTRDGSILGDGASAVVLESSSFAQQDKGRIKCRYIGSSFKQDSWRVTVPDVTKHSYSAVIEDVIKKYAISGIDLMVPHGAGIPMWDLFESKEIHRVFKKEDMPLITAFKGYFGHTLGANSLLESVALIYCLQENVIPPAFNHSLIDEKVNLPLVEKLTSRELKTVMKSVPAYGGFHAATIFEKV